VSAWGKTQHPGNLSVNLETQLHIEEQLILAMIATETFRFFCFWSNLAHKCFLSPFSYSSVKRRFILQAKQICLGFFYLELWKLIAYSAILYQCLHGMLNIGVCFLSHASLEEKSIILTFTSVFAISVLFLVFFVTEIKNIVILLNDFLAFNEKFRKRENNSENVNR